MKSEETFNKVLNYFKTTDSIYTLQRRKDEIHQTSKMIIDHFKLMEKDEKVELNDSHIKNVEKSLQIIQEILVRDHITNYFGIFVKSFVNLVFNWNSNLKGPMNISLSCKMAERYVDYHFSSIESIKILKDLHKKMRMFSDYNIPGVQLSKHYLESKEKNK